MTHKRSNRSQADKVFEAATLKKPHNSTFDKDTVVRARIASTIVTSPFLTYCRRCGASAVKKGKLGLFAFDGTVHICSSCKEERLKTVISLFVDRQKLNNYVVMVHS